MAFSFGGCLDPGESPGSGSFLPPRLRGDVLERWAMSSVVLLGPLISAFFTVTASRNGVNGGISSAEHSTATPLRGRCDAPTRPCYRHAELASHTGDIH